MYKLLAFLTGDKSIHHIILPVTLALHAIKPGLNSKPLSLSVLPFPIILISICVCHHSFAVWKVVLKNSEIHVILMYLWTFVALIQNPRLFTELSYPIFPISIEFVSVFLSKDTYTVRLIFIVVPTLIGVTVFIDCFFNIYDWTLLQPRFDFKPIFIFLL